MSRTTTTRRWISSAATFTAALTLALTGHAAAAQAGPASSTPSVAHAAVPAAAATPRPPAGTSGSIVFIKAYNVWIARGDGSHARRITRDGTRTNPYHSPSASDTSAIAVARGPLILRMTQAGRVLNRINPPALRNSVGEVIDGAVNDVSISPNGRIIAYSFVRYSCPIAADCMIRYGTGYTSATSAARVGRATYFRAPSWVTNGRTLQTGGFRSQVMLQDINRPAQHWFDDSDYAFPDTDLADGEVSPNGQWVAQVRGFKESNAVIWYRVTGNPKAGRAPAVPRYTCFTNGELQHADPTWSPDSTALAWTGKTGIWIKRAAASCTTSAPRLVIRGASEPDWSSSALK